MGPSGDTSALALAAAPDPSAPRWGADPFARLRQEAGASFVSVGTVSVLCCDTPAFGGLGEAARLCDTVVCPVASWRPHRWGDLARRWCMRDRHLEAALRALRPEAAGAGRVQRVAMGHPDRNLVAVLLPAGPAAAQTAALENAYRAALAASVDAAARLVLLPLAGVAAGVGERARREAAASAVAASLHFGQLHGLCVVLAAVEGAGALAAHARLATHRRALAADLACARGAP